MPRTRRLTAVVIAVAALTLAGCAGGAASSSSSASAAAGAGGGEADSAAAATPAGQAVAAPAAPSAAGGAKTAAGAAAVVKPRLVRTTDVVIEVDLLATSAARVRAVAGSLGGTVASETTSYALTGLPGVGSSSTGGSDTTVSGGQAGGGSGTSPAQPGESVIVLRVPVGSLDQAIDRVVHVGKELGRTASSQDVTADLADAGSRVKTQQASVERVRALLAKATSLQDIVLLESELSRRESDLEALEARQTSLADRADLSTLTVTLRTPEAKVAHEQPQDSSFVSGLKNGWHAVVVSTGIVLVVLGAVLPVLVTAAVIGLPLYLLGRRRFRRRPTPAGPGSGGPGQGDPTAP